MKTQAEYDKVLMIRDQAENKIIAIMVHDTTKQTREFYKVEKMDSDEIMMMLNNGQALDVLNGRQAKPDNGETMREIIKNGIGNK